MDLPTYTNIWRIEKRLYKLYDLRLPMPLPLGQIAAFAGITAPYVLILTLIGIPFNHNLFWLYVLPPGVLTWLATRPVLENKKLPELLVSQVRYLGEPAVWCRMSPSAEKDEIAVVGRVWHARRRPAPAAAAPGEVAAESRQPVAQAAAAGPGQPAPRGGVAGSRRPVPVPAFAGGQPAWAAPAAGGQQRHIEPRHRRPAAGSPRPAVTAAGQAAAAGRQAPAGFGQQAPAGFGQQRPGGRGAPALEARPAARAPLPRERVTAGTWPQRPPASPVLPPADRGQQPGWANSAQRTGSPGRPAEAPRHPVIEVAHAENGRRPRWPARPVRPLAARGGPGPDAPRRTGPAGPPGFAADRGQVARGGRPAPWPGGAAERPAGQGGAGEGMASGPPGGPAGPGRVAPGHRPAPWPGGPAEPPAGQGAAGERAPRETPAAWASGSAARPGEPSPPRAGADPVGQPAVPAMSERPPAVESGGPVPGGGQPAPAVTISHGPGEEWPTQTIERALSGPPGPRGRSWNDRVRLIPGGQGPGRSRDAEQEERDKSRARMPLPGPRRVVVLGCTSGAGQTVIALLTARLLASLRAERVGALDLNPGGGSLAQRAGSAPAWTVRDLLGGTLPASPAGGPASLASVQASPDGDSGPRGGDAPVPGLEVIGPGGDADPSAVKGLDEGDFARIGASLAARYAISLVDPGASAVTRVLAIADQLVLVAPASADAPLAVSKTGEWLTSHDHDALAAGAIMVINGVSGRSVAHVERAEAIASGRCRAIVRVPWEDQLGAGGGPCADAGALRLPARQALTALAGLIVSGLTAGSGEPR